MISSIIMIIIISSSSSSRSSSSSDITLTITITITIISSSIFIAGHSMPGRGDVEYSSRSSPME